MSFKIRIPGEWAAKKADEYKLKYIKLPNNKEIHVSELENKSVTSKMKSKMIMNSYAQDDLPPKLTDEALIKTAEYYLSQCRPARYPCVTYDETLIHRFIPEFIKRLREYQ